MKTTGRVTVFLPEWGGTRHCYRPSASQAQIPQEARLRLSLLYSNIRSSSSGPHHSAISSSDVVTILMSSNTSLGEDVSFVPGHGPMSSFGDERRHNSFVADDVLG